MKWGSTSILIIVLGSLLVVVTGSKNVILQVLRIVIFMYLECIYDNGMDELLSIFL